MKSTIFLSLSIIVLGITIFINNREFKAFKKEIQKSCEPIKYPTCEECEIAREKYSLYMDSIEYGPRKHRDRYEDSTRKYGPIVRSK